MSFLSSLVQLQHLNTAFCGFESGTVAALALLVPLKHLQTLTIGFGFGFAEDESGFFEFMRAHLSNVDVLSYSSCFEPRNPPPPLFLGASRLPLDALDEGIVYDTECEWAVEALWSDLQ